MACAEQYVALGVPREHVTMSDKYGVVYEGRPEDMDRWKGVFARKTELRTLGWHVVSIWACALKTQGAREWLEMRLPVLLGNVSRIETVTPAKVAEEAKVNVFRRWALMKRWYNDAIPLSEMDDGVDPNLHTGEWATRCITRALDEAMAGAPPPVA